LDIQGNIKKNYSFVDFLNKFRKKNTLKIFDYLDFRNILFLKAKTRNEAIEEMIDNLASNRTIKDKNHFYKKILERENIISTSIGMGVVIPHAKIEKIGDFFISIGVQKDSKISNWNAIDNVPIKIIIMVGGPASKQNDYLKLLSMLTQCLRNDPLRKNILSAQNPSDIIEAFSLF
jgi:nitrogen PTS system EIIA component